MNIERRNKAIITMAKTGMTYDEIGGTFGLTRERVRQILGKAGISGSTTRGARAAAKRAALGIDRDRILEWAKQNPGLRARDAENALGLPEGRVREALGSDVTRYFVRAKPMSTVQYTDMEIFASLRFAAEVQGEPLSKVAYDECVSVFGGPSGVLVAKRFETWKGACQAAGVGHNTHQGNTRRRWGKGQLVEMLLEYFESEGARGSFDDFERWAREDKPARPSAQTVRNRFGSWTAAKRAALAAGAAAVAA